MMRKLAMFAGAAFWFHIASQPDSLPAARQSSTHTVQKPLDSCPITKPSQPLFIPPAPYPLFWWSNDDKKRVQLKMVEARIALRPIAWPSEPYGLGNQRSQKAAKKDVNPKHHSPYAAARCPSFSRQPSTTLTPPALRSWAFKAVVG